MPNTRELIYKDEARGAILRHAPALAFSIDRIKAVDAVEVVRGSWIDGVTLEKCSICGKKGFSDWHYCPNCGAKMDG